MISLAITTRNRAELLGMALDSIGVQAYGPEIETVVLDDASDDGTTALLERYPWVGKHRIEREGGYRSDPAAVFNQSLGLAQGEVLIQQSAEVLHLTAVARQLAEVCRPGVVAFATVLSGASHQVPPVQRMVERGLKFPSRDWTGANPSIDRTKTRPDGGAGVAVPPVKLTIGGQRIEVYTGWLRPVPFFFCGAIHRSDWERSGGYPEGLPHGASDLQLAFALQDLGVKFAFVGTAVAFHLEHGKR